MMTSGAAHRNGNAFSSWCKQSLKEADTHQNKQGIDN
jgi:hypothetical protein